MRRISSYFAVAGEQRQVGIDFRVLRVVIAGSQMHISFHIAALTAHYEADFGMSFQLQKPEHDLHTGAFHIARQTNIRRFVKSGFQLNQRRDRFAQFGSLYQRLDYRAVFGRAI